MWQLKQMMNVIILFLNPVSEGLTGYVCKIMFFHMMSTPLLEKRYILTLVNCLFSIDSDVINNNIGVETLT